MFRRVSCGLLALTALSSAAIGAAPDPKPSGPSWGREVDGLQAGLVVSGGLRRKVGQAVPLELHLRNTGKKTIKLAYYSPPLVGWAPVVKDSKGKDVPVMTPPLDFPVSPTTKTLKPGESFSLGTSKLELRKPKDAWPSSPFSAAVAVEPGKYQVLYPYRFNREDGPDAWKGEVLSGAVTVEVVPGAW